MQIVSRGTYPSHNNDLPRAVPTGNMEDEQKSHPVHELIQGSVF